MFGVRSLPACPSSRPECLRMADVSSPRARPPVTKHAKIHALDSRMFPQHSKKTLCAICCREAGKELSLVK